jgi:hypothetical protein
MGSSEYDTHRYHRSGSLKKIISGLLLIAAVIFVVATVSSVLT